MVRGDIGQICFAEGRGSRRLFFMENDTALIAVPSVMLFFVRVNQVLVRLWARDQSSVASRRLSDVSGSRPMGTEAGRRCGRCLTGSVRDVAPHVMWRHM